MIPDYETNCVYFSDLFPKRHPELASLLTSLLEDAGVLVRHVFGTNDIWCRDYMPIQVAESRFVQFVYNPDYLSGREERTITPPEVARAAIPKGSEYFRSDIVVDGGNVVRWTNKAIMTDKVCEGVAKGKQDALFRNLQKLLDVEQLIVIPKEPGELFGHADGIVRFIDSNTVLINDYSKLNPKYRQVLLRCLDEHGLKSLELPYCPGDDKVGEQSAVGVYVNFLQVKGLLAVPVYGLPEDQEAVRLLEQAYPHSKVVPVDCRKLAEEGGVLNCVSWNIVMPCV